MSKWETHRFDIVFYDETRKGRKIDKKDYLDTGLFSIVDQGKQYIAGFTNDSTGIYEDVPAIIFGDHTRIIKYIDKPFFLGADGVKLLKSRIANISHKYLYYFLLTVPILDTGYNRHFKWLKETKIPLPSPKIQEKIADILDKASELIEKRKTQIDKLDFLVKAKFIDMFGDPVSNPMGWEVVKIKDLSKKIQYGSSEKASIEKRQYPMLRMNNITYEGNWNFESLKYIDLEDKSKSKYLVNNGEMLFNRTNSKELVGKTAVYRRAEPMAYAGYLVKFTPNENCNSEFVSAFLNSKYGKILLMSMAKSIVGMANINAKELGNIDIYNPPLLLQTEFAEFVEQVEEQKVLLQAGLRKLETNYKALMQNCFNGKLFK